jgi:transcription elongation factor Elf1
MENPDDPIAELESLWYEVIESVQNGRTANLACPECSTEGLSVEQQGDRMIVTCLACTRQVEVVMGGA